MKKLFVFAAAISVLFIVVPAYAQYISEFGFGYTVEQEQLFGVNANYNASTHTSTWSGGTDGWILTDEGDYVFLSDLDGFQSSPVSATFSVMTDLSSGGQAKASFASGSWDIKILAEGYADPVAELAGTIVGNYNETETAVSSDALNGRAVVVVNTATFNDDFWTSAIGDTIGWEGVGQHAGIIADISLPIHTNIQNYASDYASTNVVVTLYADPGVIPEPATIALIALGGLLLRKRS